MRRLSKAFPLTIVLLLLVCLPQVGCSSEQVENFKLALTNTKSDMERVQAAVEDAAELRNKVVQEIQEMPPGPDRDRAIEVVKKLDEVIDTGQRWIAKANVTLDELNRRLEKTTDALGVTEAVLQTAAPFIPRPWGVLITGFGGLAIGLIRAWRVRATGENVIRSVTPIVGKASDAELATISGLQGKAGEKFVDEAQGKKRSLPF